MPRRRATRKIFVGNVAIGGDAVISVQTMTKSATKDIPNILKEIRWIERVGGEIIRIGLPDEDSVEAFKVIRKRVKSPLIADVHFHHRIALAAIEAGADGLRINPGNMPRQYLKEISRAAGERGIPIRIGVNAGSVEKGLKRRGNIVKSMVESALRTIDLFDSFDFRLLKVSMKASSVMETVEAFLQLSDKTDLPFHIGVTEAGSLMPGTVKNSIAAGILLSMGIGDTIRVSLSAPSVKEVMVGKEILQSLQLRDFGPWIVSCPTCARREIDVFRIEKKLRKELTKMGEGVFRGLKLAVMGCEVNGPGEAGESDYGIFGSCGRAIIVSHGKVVAKVHEEEAVPKLLSLINNFKKINRSTKDSKVRDSL